MTNHIVSLSTTPPFVCMPSVVIRVPSLMNVCTCCARKVMTVVGQRMVIVRERVAIT